MNTDYSAIGVTHLINIIFTLLCIAFVWWILQAVRFDVFMKSSNNFQVRGLQMVLAIVLGYMLGKFFMDYAYWSSMLKWLF